MPKRRKKSHATSLINKLSHLGASHKKTLAQLKATGMALRAHQVKVVAATKAIRAAKKSRKKTGKKRARRR
jgi:hypothetical protein